MLFFNQKILKILSFCGLLFFCLIPASSWGFETREIGAVTVERLNMRMGAGAGFSVVKVLLKDDQVKVLSHEKGWLKVLHDSDVGYIADNTDYLKLYTIHSASDGEEADAAMIAAQSEDIKQKIKLQNEEVSKYNKQEKKTIDQLHKTDLALDKARQMASAIKAELAEADGKVADMQYKANIAQQGIDKNSGYAVKRLIALYKLNKLGEVNLLASATSLYDLMQRKSAVEKILRYDHRVISDLTERKNELYRLVDQLNLEKNKKEQLDKKYQTAVAKLAKEKKQRQKLLADIKQKKTNRLATIKYLKQASIQLDKTINALRQGSSPEQEGFNNFSAYQGLLKMPVSGNVISKYGKYVEPHSGASNFRNGIEIQSRPGTPIRAVFSGETIFSSWLKGYGNVIIIAHGKKYHTVYAHAEELFRSKGEKVKAGEVIATVGDTGAMNGPTLYFEIRHLGNPIDPLEWINKS